MTITELINLSRERAINHERALREVATLAEAVCAAADMHLVNSSDYSSHGRNEHYLRFWPNGEGQSKGQYSAILAMVLPEDWRITTDTGKGWIDVQGALSCYQYGLTIYTNV